MGLSVVSVAHGRPLSYIDSRLCRCHPGSGYRADATTEVALPVVRVVVGGGGVVACHASVTSH